MPMEVADRTFHIAYKDSEATAFAVDVDGRQYLVTARHVLEGLIDTDEIELWCNEKWLTLTVDLTGHSDVDISVMSPRQQLARREMILDCKPQKTFVGQDVYFAGFPLDLRGEPFESPFPMPLVKRAMISGKLGPGWKNPFYLDGHNNRGFSGAPVYLFDRNARRPPSVLMVVASYTAELADVLDHNDEATGMAVEQNSGIMAAFSIDNALELIAANPNGFLLSAPNDT